MTTVKNRDGRARLGAAWTSTSTLGLGLGLAVFAAISAPDYVQGSSLRSTYSLSAGEQGDPIVLDQSGRTVRMPRGAMPTYVAYKLDGESTLPAGVPTLVAAPSRGRAPNGPLRLDALAQSALDAKLAESGRVAVLTPRHTYLVESMGPRSAQRAPGDQLTAVPAFATATSSNANAAPPVSHSPYRFGDPARHAYTDASSSFKRWSQEFRDNMRSRLALRSPRHVPPHVLPAAQMLTPPAAQVLPDAAPAPVPEPGGLLVFATALAVGAWRLRSRRAGR